MSESIINTEEKKEIIKNQESNTSEKNIPKKIKKKKKAKKKKPEKECKNLKELLDEIKQEKDQKLLKEKKLKEKKKAKEENQLKENLNFINRRSISCTTTGASSLDDFNLPNYLLISNNDISENDPSEESIDKIRKMSSPIFNYYNGYDKFLSSDKEISIDLTNSANFIEKNKFISSKELNTNHININPNINDVEKNYIENNYNTNEIINNESINYNNSMMYNKENDYLNYYNYNYNYIPDSKFSMADGNNDIQNIIKNINNNYASYYTNIYKKQKNNNKKNMNKILNKSNTIRLGDWTCIYCYNLNFSFRKSCNMCNAPKPIL